VPKYAYARIERLRKVKGERLKAEGDKRTVKGNTRLKAYGGG